MDETFRLGFRRAFRAEHALIGGDWGAENRRHSHDYLWEIRLAAHGLDKHGYLVDLIALEQALDGVLARYRNAYLNDLPAFAGLNPSLERFARQLGLELASSLGGDVAVESVLWETQDAWASWVSNR
jgi:6-pyruvoyltetrahydropterin/6-carboxytetrahydropterin synthase